MRDVAKECYKNCEIGSVGFIRPDIEHGETLEGFKDVLLAAQVMQENGQILIQNVHHESQTGNRYVDSIKFMRVK